MNADPVPFLNMQAAIAELRPQLDADYARVMDSGRFLLGAELEALEHEFAAATGVAHVIGVANGLDALHLALRGLGIGRGDEVLVPAHTFIATWLAVSHAGAKPIPVDVCADGYNLDPEMLDRAVTAATKAVIPVHLYGEPAAMDAIMAFADRRGLAVVEDAAQAHGASFHGRPAGSFGAAGAFSFYPGKNLGAFADAGAITTNDGALAERLRRLRNYGGLRKYEHRSLGFNSRLGELQAAFLRTRLARLPSWNQHRALMAARYTRSFQGLSGLCTPRIHSAAQSAWHLYVICHPHRACLQRWLERAGIETLIHYPAPPHRTDAYREYQHWNLPRAERLAATVLSLPLGPHLTHQDADRVIAAVCDFCRAHEGALEDACSSVTPDRSRAHAGTL